MMSTEQQCAVAYARSHPIDAGRRLEKMPADQIVSFLQKLPVPEARDVLAQTQLTAAAACMERLPAKTGLVILRDFPPDHAARVLRIMARTQADALLSQLPSATREQITRMLSYPLNTVGALMDPTVLAVTQDLTVGDVQREFRRAARSAYYYVFVVNREHQLVGVLDLRELFMSDKSAVVKAVMRANPISVSPLTDITTLAAHPSWNDVDALPVVGKDNKLLGFIRHRTVRQQTRSAGDTRLDQVGATLARLGEIYWATLGALMATAAATVAPAQSPPNVSEAQ